MNFKWTDKDEAELERVLRKVARLKRKKMVCERLNSDKHPSKYASTGRSKLTVTYGGGELS